MMVRVAPERPRPAPEPLIVDVDLVGRDGRRPIAQVLDLLQTWFEADQWLRSGDNGLRGSGRQRTVGLLLGAMTTGLVAQGQPVGHLVAANTASRAGEPHDDD